MGYCSDAQYRQFLQQAPVFEHLLVDDGILLFKYWLAVDQAQQEERFAERHADPLKGWKLSPVDLQSRDKYEAYTQAREAMLQATHHSHAPWTLVDFNDQRTGRLTLVRDLLDRLPDTHVDEALPELPKLKGKLHREHYGLLEPIPDVV
jgi:polyphosphate kinase 2 (PPK2 family)